MNQVIASRLGVKTAELYGRVQDLVSIAADTGDDQARIGLSKIGLATLRGDYHDFRAGHPLPKGDLVMALRAVHFQSPEVVAAVGRLVDDVVYGLLDDGPEEAIRLAESVAPRARHGEREPVVLAEIKLTEREYRVFVWLYRYIEVYGLAPLLRELAAGLDTPPLSVSGILRSLEHKGAVVRVGGHRGWLPVRSP